MRKLSKTSNNQTNTLEGIANNCSCQAICNIPGRPNVYNQSNVERIQSQYAVSGTMPQGINIDA